VETADSRVRAAVHGALAADPRLPYPDEVAIDAFGGYVTLRGTVGSFAQQRAAVTAARRAAGVSGVYDELQVRLLNDHRRLDAEIRGHALERLMWDASLPGESIDAHVTDGWVTLMGNVDFQYQSNLAFEDVAGLRGVVGVTNEIRVNEVVFT
jgi:osmotically-inducible protein OsmY